MTCIQPNLGFSERLSGARLFLDRELSPLAVLADMFHDDGGSDLRLVKLRKQDGWLKSGAPTMILFETRSL